jgi:hypothetical protein
MSQAPTTGQPPSGKDKDEAPPRDGQVCQKCGAMFRWERVHADDPKSPQTLKLIEPSRRCDCGYGKAKRA